jgi:hypothetical protein
MVQLLRPIPARAEKAWMRTDEPLWPRFDAPVLQGIVSAFLRRRKAIRYHSELSCERELSKTANGASERLNFDLQPDNGNLRFSVWDDGVMWLRFCVPGSGRNSGWAFMDEFHGSTTHRSGSPLPLAAVFIAGSFSGIS